MTNDDIDDTTPDEGTRTPTDRPLGFWLRVVDSRLTAEFAEAFAAEGVSRRDWMLLNALSGDTRFPGLAEKLARRLRDKGGRGAKRLAALEDRGWVASTDGGWALTDEGRAAHERLGGIVDALRTRVAGAVSPEEFATTMTSLEAIARELGWDEDQRMPRPGFGRRGGWQRGGPLGFGRPGFDRHPLADRPGFGDVGRDAFGPNRHHGFRGHGDHGCAGEHHAHAEHHSHERHGHHGHGHHGHGRRKAERAYERGFEAGFAARRDTAPEATAPAAPGA